MQLINTGRELWATYNPKIAGRVYISLRFSPTFATTLLRMTFDPRGASLRLALSRIVWNTLFEFADAVTK
jgi:hypothetical protein